MLVLVMDPAIKKKALRLLSNGVYIITSRAGERFGAATVTWVSQVSFKPPLIMAAIRANSNVYRCLSESLVAAVHIVGAHQAEVAQKFFTPTQAGAGRINGETFTEGKTLAPVLDSAQAYLECRVRQIVEDGGDHNIVIMEVANAGLRQAFQPLTVAQSPWEYGG
jgi:flavin reductase (DIM6/NTAB) family NADH-FMN oxidoreductase RutF